MIFKVAATTSVISVAIVAVTLKYNAMAEKNSGQRPL